MKIMLSKALVLAVIVLFVGASVVPAFVAEAQFEDYELSKEIISKKVNSIFNQLPTICKQNNILISSDNSEDDMNPKITRKGNILVAAYEKVEEGLLEQTIQVSYSQDEGDTWNTKFNFNSKNSPNGSGVLQSPDIKYAPAADEFFLTMIDPLAEINNLQLVWIPSNIATTEDTKWWSTYGLFFSNYEAAACTYVEQWFLSLFTEDVEDNVDWAPGLHIKALGLIYTYHDKETDEILMPPDVYSDGAWGHYWDANLILQTAPSYKPEMATGTNRVYGVTEHYNETAQKSQIVYKATITDADTLLGTHGGGPMDMDKYADIEAWPWQQYLLEGTDPDISANGSYVCVVCSYKNIVGDWDIICAYSKDDGDNWNYSFVANESNIDEKYPAVYATETDVYCCYVKSGNLYLATSKDKGNTWSEPVKINDVDGYVVEEPGTVDLLDAGVVWTDSRNGNKDIYFDILNHPPKKPSRPSGKTNGKTGKEYIYTTSTVDPDKDNVFYLFDWGNGMTSFILGPYNSGEECNASGIWFEKGNYEIKVKAIDIHGAESEWSDPLAISMPKNKAINPFLQFLDQHPRLFPLLRQLLRL